MQEEAIQGEAIQGAAIQETTIQGAVIQEAAIQGATISVILKENNYNFFYLYNIRMLNLSLNELKLIARIRYIKGCKKMSKVRLLSVLKESKSVESKKNFDDERLKKIRKDFNELKDKFLKLI